MVTRAAASNWANLTVGLRAVNEGTKNQWKRFNHSSPKLAIKYNTNPNAPAERMSDGKTCATGASRPYVLNTTPYLSARQSDPDTDQQSLTTWFHWWPVGGSRNDTDRVSQSGGNSAPASRQIPSGRLVDGGTYVWQARTHDGSVYGSWSGTCEFTVDATAPPGPGMVTSSEYPDDSVPHGGVGLPGVFHIAPPSERPHEVKEYAWTLDSGVLTAATTVPARSTDYGAAVTVRPLHDGPNTLRVWSRDHAGRYSTSPRTYTFTVQRGAGPAAEWTFDETSGTASDVSLHGNTLTLSGDAGRVTGRGSAGSALSLTGSSTGYAATAGNVQYPHPDTGVLTALRTDTSYTVTARVRLTSTGGSGFRAVVAADATRRSPFMLGYQADENRWRFSVNTADNDTSSLYHVSSTATAVSGRWTHLTGVFDASTMRLGLYVNGVLQSTTVVPGTFNTTGRLTVGHRTWNGQDDSFLTGSVDDVRIYNYLENATRLAELAVPLPPTVSFPAGDEVNSGEQFTAVLDAGGDTNITKFRYSAPNAELDSEVTVSPPGGTAAITVTADVPVGQFRVFAVAVDDGGRVSGLAAKSITVAASAPDLAGVVIDGTTFMPAVGATVRLEPGGFQTITGADGGYAFAGVEPGSYTLSGSLGGTCGLSGVVELFVPENGTRQDLFLWPYSDGLGYTCSEQVSAFSTAGNAMALTGDDAVAEVSLPFEFPFYGASYRSAWVDTNGILSFTDPGGSHPYPGGPLPAPAEPNAVVAPFWDDLVVDGQASVRTATSGSDTDARFTVEWRNVHRKGNTSQRLSFAVVLAPDGTVKTHYDGLDNDAERGAHAAVGIEAPAGEDGLTYSASTPVLANGRSVTFDHPESGSPIQVYDLSGTLLDAVGAPVVGATVSLDPSGLTATTGPGGTWRFDGLVADSYAVTAKLAGRCGTMVNDQVELSADTVHTLRLGPDYGGLGYACTTGASGYVAAGNVFPLTGDDAVDDFALPFPFTFHGRSYQSIWIDTNGLISFGAYAGVETWDNPNMPTAAAPNAVIAPFWDDLEVDASASVRTQSFGTSPNRYVVVEWRNALIRPARTHRVTFEAILHEDGRIAFHYGAASTPSQQGAAATIGIESASGAVAALYSFQEATFLGNSSIVYTPAGLGSITGTLTTAVTGDPVAGATITLEPGGASTTTGANGGYQFPGLRVGEYTISAATGDARCAGQYARESVAHAGGASQVDLSLMTDGDEFGYRCTAGARTFVPGNVTEDWTGDDTVWPAEMPAFPVKLYGQSYTSAWISANGLITFQDPQYAGWVGSTPGPIPSPPAEGQPNASVYVHWDDWVVDSQARIATRISGVAPNRQWVVEWRNVHLWGNTAARATFEVIFSESGEITFVYADIDAANALERGSGATVGIENGSGTIGFQYLHQEARLASGQGITFQPSSPGHGTISGAVTCQGAAVQGATVNVAGLSATSAANGTYQFDDVPAGTHAVIATRPGASACRGSAVESVTVGTNTDHVIDFGAAATPAGAGYTLAQQPVAYTPAGTVLPLTGDDAYVQTALPFPVTLYGAAYTTGWVDINGLVTFIDPGEPSPDAWPIPSPASPEEPNAAVYPFWHDWVVDSSASVRTAARGTAPNREFVVEWRNVRSYEDPATRVTFQVIFHQAGGFSFAYTDIDGTFLELGGAATIGIENAAGSTALQYTHRQPLLRPGFGLRITPPTS